MFNKITITNAKYIKEPTEDKIACISCKVNGLQYAVPLDEANTHYDEIKRQVDAGELTIEDAD